MQGKQKGGNEVWAKPLQLQLLAKGGAKYMCGSDLEFWYEWLSGPRAELHCLGSGIQFELPGSRFLRIALNGNAYYMGKPIYRGTREMQLAAQRRQVAPTCPLIVAH